MNNDDVKYWMCLYLPSSQYRKEIGYIYKGTYEEVLQYMQDNHSCKCEDCINKTWIESAESCEWLIQEHDFKLEYNLRFQLAISNTKDLASLYLDDGEISDCAKPEIDYLRDDPQTIRNKLNERKANG